MERITMTVADLIKQEIDVDVYDDVCEEIGIAFCGPLELTEEGRKHFEPVLDYRVQVRYASGYPEIATVFVDDKDDKVWKERLRNAKEFFDAAAGYCASSDYDRWFKE